MITLTVSNMNFLGESEEEKRRDLCLHGSVLLKIDDDVLSDDKQCVSAGALRFMRSVLGNHFAGEEQHMLPCCGHFMIARDEGQSVEIYGCSNGVDFDVLHENDGIKIISEKKEYMLGFDEYRAVVLAFTEQVEAFYHDAPDRLIPDDAFDRSGYLAFWNEWNRIKPLLQAAMASDFVLPKIDFSDEISIAETDITSVSEAGISYHGGFINFRQCAYYYKHINGGSGDCVGTRNIDATTLSYTFYTFPKPTSIYFAKKGKIKEYLSGRPMHQRFF